LATKDARLSRHDDGPGLLAGGYEFGGEITAAHILGQRRGDRFGQVILE
jgi:hypothetical protein